MKSLPTDSMHCLSTLALAALLFAVGPTVGQFLLPSLQADNTMHGVTVTRQEAVNVPVAASSSARIPVSKIEGPARVARPSGGGSGGAVRSPTDSVDARRPRSDSSSSSAGASSGYGCPQARSVGSYSSVAGRSAPYPGSKTARTSAKPASDSKYSFPGARRGSGGGSDYRFPGSD